MNSTIMTTLPSCGQAPRQSRPTIDPSRRARSGVAFCPRRSSDKISRAGYSLKFPNRIGSNPCIPTGREPGRANLVQSGARLWILAEYVEPLPSRALVQEPVFSRSGGPTFPGANRSAVAFPLGNRHQANATPVECQGMGAGAFRDETAAEGGGSTTAEVGDGVVTGCLTGDRD